MEVELNKEKDAEAGGRVSSPVEEASSDIEGMKPMAVKTASEVDDGGSGSGSSSASAWFREPETFGDGLTPFQKLYTDKKVLMRSLLAVYFGVFTDAVTATLLQPNYLIMSFPPDDPRHHPESFSSTAPFDVQGATYFLQMAGMLGAGVASIGMGALSDKFGRKPILLICLYASIILTAAKWFARGSFWGFCGASFINGLCSASLPVATAYVADVYSDNPDESVKQQGFVIAIAMLGTSLGGGIAILMTEQGLFAPLWAGVALMVVSSLIATFLMIEPKNVVKPEASGNEDDDDDDDVNKAPETINYPVLILIIFGMFLDNVGSSGLLPLCLSPLAVEVYQQDFIDRGLEPLMTQDAYKWILTLSGLLIIPGSIASPIFFRKIGIAAGCVAGNFVTAVTTVVLLLLAELPAASRVTYIVFILILFLGFPFTVLSQLSTAPMLDIISPADKRGMMQGLNGFVMNITLAVTPFVFGVMSDQVGSWITIWTCIGISFAAALVNAPLIFVKGFGKPPKVVPAETKALKFEDEDLINKALAGELIAVEDFEKLNEVRQAKGKPYLIVHPGTYEGDKHRLDQLRKQAKDDYVFEIKLMDDHIKRLNEAKDVQGLIDSVNKAYDADPELVKQANTDLGQWFADYLQDAGYYAHTYPQLTKQMIMTAFPVITHDKKITQENAQTSLLKARRIYRNYANIEALSEDETVFDQAINLFARGGRVTNMLGGVIPVPFNQKLPEK